MLLETGFDHSVSNVFHDNKVDGAVLVDLDKDNMKKLWISIAGQKKLQQLIYKLKRSKRVTDFCIYTSHPIMHCPAVYVSSPSLSSSDSCVEIQIQGQKNSPCNEETDSGTEEQDTLYKE